MKSDLDQAAGGGGGGGGGVRGVTVTECDPSHDVCVLCTCVCVYLVCVHLLSVCVSVYVSVCVYVCMCVCMYVCAMCVRCDVLLFVLVCFLKVGFLSYTLTQLHRVVLLCIEHMRLHYLPMHRVFAYETGAN